MADGPVLRATRVALRAAGLTVSAGPDAGAVAVLLRLARTIDAMDTEEPGLEEGERRPRRAFDNVTVPTYLKYAEALGLTPAARAREASSGGSEGGGAGGRKPASGLAAVLDFAAQATG